MLRSLDTAVSGIKAHQLRLDVIGNNIANVNTTGFKYSRVQFAESFAQTIRGALAPNGNNGGVNPLLAGMGVEIQSIDTIHSQGTIEQTDKATDAAINGNGYFIVHDKAIDLASYTRNGNFGLNANGILTTQDGLFVQGWMANNTGTVNNATPVGDITIPLDETMVPKSTTSVSFGGNLYHPQILDPASSVANQFGNFIPTPAADGSAAAINVTSGQFVINGVSVTGSIPVVAANTRTFAQSLQELADMINKFTPQTNVFATMKTVPDVAGTVQARIILTSSVLGDDSQIVVSGTAIPQVNATAIVNAGTTTTETITNYGQDAGGNGVLAGAINFASGAIVVNGVDIGSLTTTPLTNTSEQNAQSILALINAKTSLHGVTAETDGNGHIRFRSKAKDIILSGSSVGQDGTTAGADVTTRLYAGLNKARNATVYSGATIDVYDAGGGKHPITYYYNADYNEVYGGVAGNNWLTGTRVQNDWHWATSTTDTQILLDSKDENGNETDHTIKFDQRGVLQTVNGKMRMHFNSAIPVPPGGFITRDWLQPQVMKINLGTTGKTDGLTQFMTPATLAATDQDGYTKGDLISFNIASTGVINGIYDNGRRKAIAQLALANFVNPMGLTRSASNSQGSHTVFQETENSGRARIGTAQSVGYGEVKGSALELSNVDLTNQFTDMIVTERGFQANARVITTSDEILQEVVALKR